MITRVYCDTNVYNRIADNILLPIRPGIFGPKWSSKVYLSPLNVLEILQIKDDLRRETIIRILQELCAPEMLADPETLLVDFISEKMQLNSLAHLRLSFPFSKSALGIAWQDIHLDASKTFIFNDDVHTKVYHLKLLSKLLHAWNKSGRSLNDNVNITREARSVLPGDFVFLIKQAIKELKPIGIKPTPWPINDLILILSTSVLVSGVTPFPEAIDELWAALGITTIENKIRHVLDGPMKFVLSEGPLVGMASIMASQVSKKFSSGNLLDAFHITYLPYISELLTLDETLLTFTRAYPKSPNFVKVQDASPFLDEIKSYLRTTQPRQS